MTHRKPRTIAENLARLTDDELISVLPWIRDENGEKVSLIELRHYLRKVTHIEQTDPIYDRPGR